MESWSKSDYAARLHADSSGYLELSVELMIVCGRLGIFGKAKSPSGKWVVFNALSSAACK